MLTGVRLAIGMLSGVLVPCEMLGAIGGLALGYGFRVGETYCVRYICRSPGTPPAFTGLAGSVAWFLSLMPVGAEYFGWV